MSSRTPIAYRIQHNREDPSALLNRDRADGWVASDESYETQPHGISACATLADLAKYARKYSMSLVDGTVLALYGEGSQDADRDEHAIRVYVTGWDVLGASEDFAQAVKLYEDVAEELADPELADGAWDGISAPVRALIEGILA